MVWEQEASLVIMLTTTVERGRVSGTLLSLLLSLTLSQINDGFQYKQAYKFPEILLQPLLTIRDINLVYLDQIKLTLVVNFCFIT